MKDSPNKLNNINKLLNNTKDKFKKTYKTKIKPKIVKFLKIILPDKIMSNRNSALVFKRLILFALLLFVLQGLFVSIAVFIVVKSGGKSFTLPDVQNKGIYEAIKILEKEKVNLNIRANYFNNYPLGIIVSQAPKGGVKIKKGRTVYLVVNAPEEITLNMPDITGLKYEEALNIISNDIISRLPNVIIHPKVESKEDMHENDIVLSQSPSANEIIKSDSEITLIVNNKE